MTELNLFEVSWEVCNKVGGIHTVLSTKAKTLIERLGDDGYIAVGPWILRDNESTRTFADEPGFESFTESCREMGLPVRVGRWLIPGRPRTIQVEFSRLLARKDEILARLWEIYKVDSLLGSWDYIEPLMFGYAAGQIIERWVDDRDLGARPMVAQFHEWMTGSGLLYLKRKLPEMGTVFTTHATMLGRALAARGFAPLEHGAHSPADAASQHGITAKHSMEGVCAREADVFTTVSDITADEAERFHGRRPSPTLPNGIDLDVMEQLTLGVERNDMVARLRRFGHRFLGEPIEDAAFLAVSGRYEMHNKGIDLLLEALAVVNRNLGRRVVLFILVPAGQSGIHGELLDRLRQSELDATAGPLGLTTHNLFDPEHDPILTSCRQLSLNNERGARVKVIFIPVYLGGVDGLLNASYEAVLRAMDLTLFPSFYEPWGYTPEESLSLGVPTVTTDLAGFGMWAVERGLSTKDGVQVLARRDVADQVARERLTEMVEAFLASSYDRQSMVMACQATARATAWSDLLRHYFEAFDQAIAAADQRVQAGLRRQPRHFPMVSLASGSASQRPRLQRFEIGSSVPDELAFLERLSHNFWWSWNADAERLFEWIAPTLWHTCRHNPVVFLDEVPSADLQRKAADEGYMARLRKVEHQFNQYLGRAESNHAGISEQHPVAYFCAEFGLHESLPIYSGGLGILAGDHLKSASDLGLPLVGVGLFYRRYSTQQLSRTGDQIYIEHENDPSALPLQLVLDDNGQPLEVTLQLPSTRVVLQVWRVMVGRVPLYLLDADVAGNRAEDRTITHWLYGGDQENRLRQEIVLGRGGLRLLRRLGIDASVHHLNEGHAAFVVIERVARLVHEDGLTFEEAHELVRATTAFTTHTPVPAGHDRFSEHLVRRYFSNIEELAGLVWERFYAFGVGEGEDGNFNMTYLAARFAGVINGVSQAHGAISRRILHPVWPMRLVPDVPIAAITNGVHLPTWTDPELARALGAVDRPVRGDDFVERAGSVADDELWRLRNVQHARLKQTVAARLQQAFLRRHESPTLLRQMLAGLDGDPLIIGFARRFVPYKRAQLILREPERLRAILGDPLRPVRLLFAGKAHPNDQHGQDILRQVAQLARSPEFLGRILFLEDYDIELARALVRGVDVWLNNPTRPLEASGTSGMKVAANGGLHLSIADGWWIEGFDGTNGWTISDGDHLPSPELRDDFEASHLYQLLESDVKPLFFTRDERGMPLGWLARVRSSLRSIAPRFDTNRMVGDYLEQGYTQLARGFHTLRGDAFGKLRQVTARHQRVRKGFADLGFRDVRLSDLRDVRVRETVEIQTQLELGALTVDDLQVELVLGAVRRDQELEQMKVVTLTPIANDGAIQRTFVGSVKLEHSGACAYGIRVRAKQSEPWDGILSDLMLWADARPAV